MTYCPCFGPASGSDGMAQVDEASPSTSGTCAWMRPICWGSVLVTTVPRYLPKYLAGSGISRSLPVWSRNDDGRQGDQPLADEGEVLRVGAAFDVVSDALDVIEAVVGDPGAAHADQPARREHLAVTEHVELTGSGY